MKILPAAFVLGCLAAVPSGASAQAIAPPVVDDVVVSPPPTVLPGGSYVVKEKRRLFRPRTRVYVVRPGKVRVPATATVVEPAPRRATIVEPPSTVIESPARIEKPPVTGPDLEKPENPEAEVRYLAPTEPSPNRPAAVIRSTPRGS